MSLRRSAAKGTWGSCSQTFQNIPNVVGDQSQMPFVFNEAGFAIREGTTDVASDRNRNVVVLLSMPQLDLAGDVL
jgi:hypothetical protein